MLSRKMYNAVSDGAEHSNALLLAIGLFHRLVLKQRHEIVYYYVSYMQFLKSERTQCKSILSCQPYAVLDVAERLSALLFIGVFLRLVVKQRHKKSLL